MRLRKRGIAEEQRKDLKNLSLFRAKLTLTDQMTGRGGNKRRKASEKWNARYRIIHYICIKGKIAEIGDQSDNVE